MRPEVGAVGHVVLEDVLGQPGDQEAHHVPGQCAVAAVETFAEGAKLGFEVAMTVLVVFVLAEVFREGARLRREAELTI